MSYWGQFSFPDAVSKNMKNIVLFHDHCLVLEFLIVSLVFFTMGSIIFNTYSCSKYVDSEAMEEGWVVVPILVLSAMAIPSFCVLYSAESSCNPAMTVKALGRQWYWSYEYGDLCDLSFDSYMVGVEDLKVGEYRLLEVDNRLVVPAMETVRMIVSSSDVIHSLSVPSMGVKVDAIPGRLNQVFIKAVKSGVYYGMCSEICGVNHAFMPICVEVLPVEYLASWSNKISVKS